MEAREESEKMKYEKRKPSHSNLSTDSWTEYAEFVFDDQTSF